MCLKTVHISNCTKVFWKRVPEPWRCYHKALSPNVFDRTAGMESKILSEDLRLYEDDLNVSKSHRYLGARPWIALNVIRSILNSIALIWLLHVKFSSINTPRDLVKVTLFNCVPLISKAGIADRLTSPEKRKLILESTIVWRRQRRAVYAECTLGRHALCDWLNWRGVRLCKETFKILVLNIPKCEHSTQKTNRNINFPVLSFGDL